LFFKKHIFSGMTFAKINSDVGGTTDEG